MWSGLKNLLLLMRRAVLIKVLLLSLFVTSSAFATGTFAKHDASLLQLTGKINADEKAIVELIKEKNHTSNTARTHEIAAEIKKLLKSRRENIEKYNKEYYHVEYEHPGQMDSPELGKKKEEKPSGHDEKKKEGAVETAPKKVRYKRYDEKTIKEFEDEINKTLSDVYGNVKNKYNNSNEK